MDDLGLWNTLGQKLGLTAAVVSEGSMLGWSFASFRREIAEPATKDPKTTPWLHGTWKGVATIVRPVRRVSPAPERTGGWLAWHSPTDLLVKDPIVSQYTMALAEISPPLFAGVRMSSASLGNLRFGGPHATPLVRIEPARLDRAFSIYAANQPRLQRLFEPRDSSDTFPELLAAAAERTPIAIQDGVVEVFLPGTLFDPTVVGGELDAAVAIAKELSLRSSELEEDPKVAAIKHAWADVATSRGLQFDPLRWHAYGHIDDARIEVLLEPTDSFVRTTVRAAFRTPLDVVPRTTELVEAFRLQVKNTARVTAHCLVNDAEVLLAQERCVAPQELATLIDHAMAIVDAANHSKIVGPRQKCARAGHDLPAMSLIPYGLGRAHQPLMTRSTSLMSSSLLSGGAAFTLVMLAVACGSTSNGTAGGADGSVTSDGGTTNADGESTVDSGGMTDGFAQRDVGTPQAPFTVNLGTAGQYAILAKSGISTVPTSAITGDIAVSPITASAITGFALSADATNVFATDPQVTGKVFAADYAPPTPSKLTTAIGDMELAFTDAAGRAPKVTELGAGDIGGMTLTAGVYKWGTGLLIPTNVTLSGSATDVWVFQIAQDLTVSSAANVILQGGALPKNIFWQVSGAADVGTTAHLEGVVLSQTAVALHTGASINGRLLAQTAVSIDGSTVVQPSP